MGSVIVFSTLSSILADERLGVVTARREAYDASKLAVDAIDSHLFVLEAGVYAGAHESQPHPLPLLLPAALTRERDVPMGMRGVRRRIADTTISRLNQIAASSGFTLNAILFGARVGGVVSPFTTRPRAQCLSHFVPFALLSWQAR